MVKRSHLHTGGQKAMLDIKFDNTWDHLIPVAVFTAGSITKDYVIRDPANVPVPKVCLEQSNEAIWLGIRGVADDGTEVIPTVNVMLGISDKLNDPTDDGTTEADMAVWEQILWQVNRACDLANEVQRKAEAGAFNGTNGISPVLQQEGVAQTLSYGARPTVQLMKNADGHQVIQLGIPEGKSYTESEQFLRLSQQVHQDALHAAKHMQNISATADKVKNDEQNTFQSARAAVDHAQSAYESMIAAQTAEGEVNAAKKTISDYATNTQNAVETVNTGVKAVEAAKLAAEQSKNNASAAAQSAKQEAERAKQLADSIPGLDTSLTKAGYAADAQAVGNALAGKEERWGDYVRIDTITLAQQAAILVDVEPNGTPYDFIAMAVLIEIPDGYAHPECQGSVRAVVQAGWGEYALQMGWNQPEPGAGTKYFIGDIYPVRGWYEYRFSNRNNSYMAEYSHGAPFAVDVQSYNRIVGLKTDGVYPAGTKVNIYAVRRTMHG